MMPDRLGRKVQRETDQFKAPYNQEFLADSSVVVADYKAGTLTRLAAGKSRDKSELASGPDGPLGLVVADDRQLYVGEYNGGRIRLRVTFGLLPDWLHWLRRLTSAGWCVIVTPRSIYRAVDAPVCTLPILAVD
ncbi:MAG: hypothetical protein QGH93_13530 [Gammaproteobacteria bacterium]|jgi:hypothetical protein|nr:hypothetical protein [Chromatiales bacterium]MDP6675856.1 hypothetical protein [Gammaproteobacteria bacterium]